MAPDDSAAEAPAEEAATAAAVEIGGAVLGVAADVNDPDVAEEAAGAAAFGVDEVVVEAAAGIADFDVAFLVAAGVAAPMVPEGAVEVAAFAPNVAGPVEVGTVEVAVEVAPEVASVGGAVEVAGEVIVGVADVAVEVLAPDGLRVRVSRHDIPGESFPGGVYVTLKIELMSSGSGNTYNTNTFISFSHIAHPRSVPGWHRIHMCFSSVL